MNLENLVPPLELCKQIPAGAFADSALVWYNDGFFWKIAERYTTQAVEVPAPTLHELLADMANGNETWESHYPELNYNDFCGGWIVRGRTLNIERSGIFPDWIDVRDKNNPATAALKLWLEMEAGK